VRKPLRIVEANDCGSIQSKAETGSNQDGLAMNLSCNKRVRD